MDKLHSKTQGNYRPVGLAHDGSPIARNPLPPDNWPYPNRPSTPQDPSYGIKNPKFERHIFISRDQIFYDIDAQIAIMSKARRKDNGTEDDTFSNATTDFQQQFFRWIDRHIGIAKGVMSAFVLEKFKTTNMNSISQKEEVDITLLLPEWYDDTVFDQLTSAVHDYVTNATLFEYFSLALPANDAVTATKREQMDTSLNDVRKYVNASKPGRVRKPYNPF